MRGLPNFPLVSLLFVASVASVAGQDVTSTPVDSTDPRSADRAKIEAAIESYVDAFNAKDVDKLVGLWSADGVYVSRTSGNQVSGHDALKEDFRAIFAGDDVPKLAVETESIEFISPNVALERGSALVSRSDSSEETTYQAVYVKTGDGWLIDRVSEDIVESKPSNYEHLKGLEFLVGDWFSEGEGMEVEIDCQWTSNQNYLARKYKVTAGGEVDSSGLQIIGWDAKNQQIRSWLFDSDGGFVKGEWSVRDDGWVVQSVATLADGASGSSTSFWKADGDGISWRKFNRVVDGELLPNTEEVILQRR